MILTTKFKIILITTLVISGAIFAIIQSKNNEQKSENVETSPDSTKINPLNLYLKNAFNKNEILSIKESLIMGYKKCAHEKQVRFQGIVLTQISLPGSPAYYHASMCASYNSDSNTVDLIIPFFSYYKPNTVSDSIALKDFEEQKFNSLKFAFHYSEGLPLFSLNQASPGSISVDNIGVVYFEGESEKTKEDEFGKYQVISKEKFRPIYFAKMNHEDSKKINWSNISDVSKSAFMSLVQEYYFTSVDFQNLD